MKKITMNSLLFILILVLFSCNPSIKTHRGQYDSLVLGEWLQVKTVLGNKNSHMVGPNLWIFTEKSCKVMIGKNEEYGYKLFNNQFVFFPIEGHSYVKWQEALMFGKFALDITDSTMVLTRKDTLQLFFEREYVYLGSN